MVYEDVVLKVPFTALHTIEFFWNKARSSGIKVKRAVKHSNIPNTLSFTKKKSPIGNKERV
jgi:hypothetical protein